MEVYKDLSSKAVKEFENLLNSQMSKVKIEEGKIINGTVTKIFVKDGEPVEFGQPLFIIE